MRLLTGEGEIGGQNPAEFLEGREGVVLAGVAGDAEPVGVRDLDLDVVAFLQRQPVDERGGQADGQTVAPFADLVGFL